MSDENSKNKIIVAIIGAIGLIIAAIFGSPYLADLFKSNSSAPKITQPSQIEQKLADKNIALSQADENRVRGWLISDPAYQALANNTLHLLQTNRIVGTPIALDVINGRYKELLGVSSSDYVTADKYNDQNLLKQAIFMAWSDRQPAGYTQKSYKEILAPIASSP